MKALVLRETGLNLEEVPTPVATDRFVRVRLSAAALNRRDQWIREGKYPNIVHPAILGSDGCGVVDMAPSAPSLLGQRVVIDPGLEWGVREDAQGPRYRVLGMPDQGTLADYIVTPEHNVRPAPQHLTDAEAAALPLAGLTAWRALMVQGEASADTTILVTGIGGGVAGLVADLVVALGARLLVTSTSQQKIEAARERGAIAGFLTTNSGWHKELTSTYGPPDLIVDSIGGAFMNDLFTVIRPGGTIVSYGSTLGPVPSLGIHRLFWKQIRLIGSTMGTPTDFTNMLEFVERTGIRPRVDTVLSIHDAESAFDRLARSEQTGKVVIRIV